MYIEYKFKDIERLKPTIFCSLNIFHLKNEKTKNNYQWKIWKFPPYLPFQCKLTQPSGSSTRSLILCDQSQLCQNKLLDNQVGQQKSDIAETPQSLNQKKSALAKPPFPPLMVDVICEKPLISAN